MDMIAGSVLMQLWLLIQLRIQGLLFHVRYVLFSNYGIPDDRKIISFSLYSLSHFYWYFGVNFHSATHVINSDQTFCEKIQEL
jgi:hypothetical protein